MAVQIPPGFALAAWEFRFPGDPDPWYCTCGVDLDGWAGSMPELANTLHQMWAEGPLIAQNTNCSLAGVTLKVGSDGAPTMAYSDAAALPGGTAQNVLPQNCALLVDKMSNTGGRRGRGRFYVPASLAEDGVDNVGFISEGNHTSYVTVWNDFFADWATNLIAPVILHSPSADDVVNPTPIGTPTPITGFRVQRTISTQRDRLR